MNAKYVSNPLLSNVAAPHPYKDSVAKDFTAIESLEGGQFESRWAVTVKYALNFKDLQYLNNFLHWLYVEMVF